MATVTARLCSDFSPHLAQIQFPDPKLGCSTEFRRFEACNSSGSSTEAPFHEKKICIFAVQMRNVEGTQIARRERRSLHSEGADALLTRHELTHPPGRPLLGAAYPTPTSTLPCLSHGQPSSRREKNLFLGKKLHIFTIFYHFTISIH